MESFLESTRFWDMSNGVHPLHNNTVDSLRDEAVRLGFHFLYANLHGVAANSIYSSICRQMLLPISDKKGRDQEEDHVVECLTKRLFPKEFRPIGVIVVVEGFGSVVAGGSPLEFVLEDAFTGIAEYWQSRSKGQHIPFHVYLSTGAVDRFLSGHLEMLRSGAARFQEMGPMLGEGGGQDPVVPAVSPDVTGGPAGDQGVCASLSAPGSHDDGVPIRSGNSKKTQKLGALVLAHNPFALAGCQQACLG